MCLPYMLIHASAKRKYAPGAKGRSKTRDSWAAIARRRTWSTEASGYLGCARHFCKADDPTQRLV